MGKGMEHSAKGRYLFARRAFHLHASPCQLKASSEEKRHARLRPLGDISERIHFLGNSQLTRHRDNLLNENVNSSSHSFLPVVGKL